MLLFCCLAVLYAPAKAQSNSFVYVTDQGSDSVSGYSIDPATGALTMIPGSPFGSGGTAPIFIAFVPVTSRCAVVANLIPGTVQSFNVNPSTGALTPFGAPLPAFLAGGLAFDPSGRFVYASSLAGAIFGFTLDTNDCGLTPMAASPFASLPLLGVIQVEPGGRWLYVTVVDFPGAVLGYAIDPVTGALTLIPGSPFPAGDFPQYLAITPSAKFLYATNEFDDTISGYAIDPSTGVLTPVPGSPFATGFGPVGIAIHPNGNFLYDADLNDVSAFSIDAATGALTPIAGSPFPNVAGGLGLFGLTTDPRGVFLYAADQGSDNVSAFTINPSTGALSTTAFSGPYPAGFGPTIIVAVTLGNSAATLDGAFQTKLFPNLSAGDSVINIGNTGASSVMPPGAGLAIGGNLCVNVYVFSPDEQEVACCTCLVTPNGVVTTSARQLITKTLTPAVPSAVTVKMIATDGTAGAAACNAAVPGTLEPGLIAFGTNLHAAAVGGSITSGTFAMTETPFVPSTLSPAELSRITTLCGFIQSNGTGFGVCPGCSAGAAGAVKR